jgi:anthranilate phosphoribosyltransferase
VYTLGRDLPENCTVTESAAVIREVLENKLKDRDPESLVLINAAAALYVAEKAATLEDAYENARDSIRGGAALEKLNAMAAAVTT